jgi:hypothetical protein
VLFYIELVGLGEVRRLAAIQALKGVIQDTTDYGRLYPVWNYRLGNHSGVIVVDALEIVNVTGMIVQHDRDNIRHLVPPREKIWNHTLLTEEELHALSTRHPA